MASLFLITLVAWLIILLGYLAYCENGHRNVLVYPFPKPTATPSAEPIRYLPPYRTLPAVYGNQTTPIPRNTLAPFVDLPFPTLYYSL